MANRIHELEPHFLAWPSRVYGHQEAFRGNLQCTGIVESIGIRLDELCTRKLSGRWSRDRKQGFAVTSPPRGTDKVFFILHNHALTSSAACVRTRRSRHRWLICTSIANCLKRPIRGREALRLI